MVVNEKSFTKNREFGSASDVLTFTIPISSVFLFFWILPSCALLSGVKRNHSCMFVPWILSMILQSFMLIIVTVRGKEFSSMGVVLLPVAIFLQCIVWRDFLRIRTGNSREDWTPKNMFLIPVPRFYLYIYLFLVALFKSDFCYRGTRK